MSSVTVFAFIDKEGIVTESQKFVDELAIINEKEEKVIIDLTHKKDAKSQVFGYQFEGLHGANIEKLQALGLALSCCRNPKEGDTNEVLKEIFLRNPEFKLQKSINKKPGFYFQNCIGRESVFH